MRRTTLVIRVLALFLVGAVAVYLSLSRVGAFNRYPLDKITVTCKVVRGGELATYYAGMEPNFPDDSLYVVGYVVNNAPSMSWVKGAVDVVDAKGRFVGRASFKANLVAPNGLVATPFIECAAEQVDKWTPNGEPIDVAALRAHAEVTSAEFK